MFVNLSQMHLPVFWKFCDLQASVAFVIWPPPNRTNFCRVKVTSRGGNVTAALSHTAARHCSSLLPPLCLPQALEPYLEVQVLSKLTAPHQHPLGVDAVRAASPEGL